MSAIRDELRSMLSASEEELRLPPPNPIILETSSNFSGISRAEILADGPSSERHKSSIKLLDKSASEIHNQITDLPKRSEISNVAHDEWVVDKSNKKGAWKGYGKLPSISSDWIL